MAQLRLAYEQFKANDAEIIVLGPEDAKSFRDFWDAESLPFVGLPDPQHRILKLYGQEVNLFKLGRMPAQVTIDKSGVVRYVRYGHAMSDIPTNEEILQIIQELNLEKISS